MPKCINDSSKNYKGTEPSPKGLGYCAHVLDVDYIMVGLDNSNWKVVQTKNGQKRWIKIKSKDEQVNKIVTVSHLKIKYHIDYYYSFRALNFTDHIINNYNSNHPAYYLVTTDNSNILKDLCKKIEVSMEKIDYKRLEHPNSSLKVWDLIHPSHYPYIKGKTLNNEDIILSNKYKTHEIKRRSNFYLSRHNMKESNFRWIPTVYKITENSSDYIEIEQKGYINDLFIDDVDLKIEIETIIINAFGYAYQMFEKLGELMNFKYNFLKNKDLQVIVKSSYYELKPGESHEGVWHVEGMPDEHIIMANILYYQDDFNDAVLEFRRDVSEREEQDRMMILPQNTEVDEKDSQLQEHLYYLNTKRYSSYAWANGCQHRLMKITNNSNEVKKRSFIAFFLIDPDVPMIDTTMVKEQNQYISNEDAIINMKNLMEERQKVKVELNSNLKGEISYCEH